MVRAKRRPFQIVPLTGDRLQSVYRFATPKFILDICTKLWYNSFCNCGYSTSASISAFQAEEVGSIPIARSMQTKNPTLCSDWHSVGFLFYAEQQPAQNRSVVPCMRLAYVILYGIRLYHSHILFPRKMQSFHRAQNHPRRRRFRAGGGVHLMVLVPLI